jgi:hypothetical protein
MEDKSALVVIPTTGSVSLKRAIDGVVSQTHHNTTCLVIIDGPQFEDHSLEIIAAYPQVRVKHMVLPWNIGSNGWYGHRAYYLSAPLMEQDYWFALDQDNWFERDHVSSMISACETHGWQWAHSLRKIFSSHGTYVCDDDCESLGRYPVYLSDQHHLVDTSTYCIRREVMVQVAPAWYSGWGGDRRFYAAISQNFPKFGCTGKSTVCYGLDGNPGSVNADFFLQGNTIMRQRYPGGFPWRV